MNKQLQNILHKPDITGNIEYLQKLENETYEKAYEYKTLKNELLISQRDLRGNMFVYQKNVHIIMLFIFMYMNNL